MSEMYFLCVENCIQLHGPSPYNMYSLCIHLYLPVQTRAVQYVLFVHLLVPTSLDRSRYNMHCLCIHSYQPVQTRAGTICIVRAFTRTDQSRPEPVQYVLFVHLLVPTSLDQSRYNMYCSCIHSYEPVQTGGSTICAVRAFTRNDQSRPEPVQYVLFVHSLIPTSLDQRQYNMCCSCIHSYQPGQTRAGTICTVRAFTRTDQCRTEPVQYIPYVHSLILTSLDPL